MSTVSMAVSFISAVRRLMMPSLCTNRLLVTACSRQRSCKYW